MNSLDFLIENIVGDLRNSIVKGLKPEIGPEMYKNLQTGFDKVSSWAKNRLRKGEVNNEGAPVDNAKVVWLLNWYVLDTKLQYCCGNIGDSIYTDSETQKIKNKAQRYPEAGFDSRGIFPNNDVSAFVTSLVHFLGTPSISQRVQGMPLKPDMTPLEALDEWKGMEDEWLQSLKDEKRSIAHDTEYRFGRYQGRTSKVRPGEEQENRIHYLEPIIEFQDGSAWFNLNREECKQEGDSMGHCGNTAGHKSTDTIYSYRTAHPDKENHWIPHLTFIYDQESGMLGEMKGYGNQKPTKKYHDVIRTLITSEHVAGIVGGGYLPEENFSVWDLADAEELVEKKPKLAGDNLQKYINNMGVDESFEGMVQAKLGEDQIFEIIDKEQIDSMSKSYRLDLVEVRLTDIYPNFEELIQAEFHDSPYWQLLKGNGEWDMDETAIQMVDQNHESGLEERFEQIMQYSPSTVKAIIVEELAYYSNEDPSDVEDNMWKYIQEHGGDFSDWIVQATSDATLVGYQSGLRDAIFHHAVRYIEEFGNGYLGYGAKEVELSINAKKLGRWDDKDNPTFIQAKMMEVVEVITDMESHGEQIPNDWWAYHAVEYDENDLFTQETIIDEVHYDYIKAIGHFNESIMEAPKLHDGKEFYVKYDELDDGKGKKVSDLTHGNSNSRFAYEAEQNWKPVLDEEGKDLMLPLVKKLNKVARTKTVSKKEHDNMHRLAQLAGLSNPDKTVHKVLKKSGYN